LAWAPGGNREDKVTMNPTLLAGGIGAVAVVILLIGFLTARSEQGEVKERLDRFVEADRKATPTQVGPVKRSTPLADALNRFLTGRAFADKISIQLARADLKVTVGEYLALSLIAVIGGAVIAYLISGRSLPFALVGVAAGYFAPGIYISYMQGRRLKLFNDQLGDTINLLVNGLRTGFSVLQAMEAVARELPQPVAGEFDRVVKEVQLGLTLEQALQNMLRRVKSEDLDLVVTAINVQREVGGNLAEILDVISHTIRERVRIKGEISVLTAQGMITGYVITALPLALMALLYLINRDYVQRLWTTPGPCGWAMLIAGAILIVSGFLIIQKIVRIEV
jgi:tight adherence protein B